MQSVLWLHMADLPTARIAAIGIASWLPGLDDTGPFSIQLLRSGTILNLSYLCAAVT